MTADGVTISFRAEEPSRFSSVWKVPAEVGCRVLVYKLESCISGTTLDKLDDKQ